MVLLKIQVLKLLKDYVIGFVNCKEIFVYGIILSEKMNGSIEELRPEPIDKRFRFLLLFFPQDDSFSYYFL